MLTIWEPRTLRTDKRLSLTLPAPEQKDLAGMEKAAKGCEKRPRGMNHQTPSKPQTSVNSPKGPRRRKRAPCAQRRCTHGGLPVRGVGIVKLPRNHPTHQQPPVVHDGSAPSLSATGGRSPCAGAGTAQGRFYPPIQRPLRVTSA